MSFVITPGPYASAAEQLNPAGFTKVWDNYYSTPGPDADVIVETLDFQTADVMGVTIGGVAGMVSKLQQEAIAHGSDMYGLALYRRTIHPVDVSVPCDVFGIPIPFCGPLLVTTEYRLVAVHSQFQFGLAAIAFAVAIGLVIFVVANLHNEIGAFKGIAQDFATAFGGGQASSITNEFIWFFLAAGVTSVGAYLILRDVTQSTGLGPNAVRVPLGPNIQPLQNVSPSTQLVTPAGSVGVGPGGTGVNLGMSQRRAAQQGPRRRR